MRPIRTGIHSGMLPVNHRGARPSSYQFRPDDLQDEITFDGELGNLEGMFDIFKKPVQNAVQGAAKSTIESMMPSKTVMLGVGVGAGLLIGLIIGHKLGSR